MPRRSSMPGKRTADDAKLDDASLTTAKRGIGHLPKPVREALTKKRGTDHDFATVARRVVEQAIGEQLDGSPLPDKAAGKNPHAVALGKLGGQKGGKARADKLSPAKRKAIARAAAKARWRP